MKFTFNLHQIDLQIYLLEQLELLGPQRWLLNELWILSWFNRFHPFVRLLYYQHIGLQMLLEPLVKLHEEVQWLSEWRCYLLYYPSILVSPMKLWSITKTLEVNSNSSKNLIKNYSNIVLVRRHGNLICFEVFIGQHGTCLEPINQFLLKVVRWMTYRWH